MSRLIESTLRRFARALSDALISEQIATRRGLLQSLDARVRVLALFALVLAVLLSRRILIIAALLAVAALLALASRVSLGLLAKRVWLVALGFTGIIAIPALFITPGPPLGKFASMTSTGLRSAILLITRVETAATLTTLLVLTTPWNYLLKALRALKLPAEVVTVLAMTHRYIFLLIESANQMFESRQSRMVGVLSSAEQRRMTARTAGVLLSKSIELSQDVYLAMQSRGFRGEVHALAGSRMTAHDFAALALAILAATAAVWIGR